MWLSKITIFILVVIIVLAVFVAKINNLITIKHNSVLEVNENADYLTQVQHNNSLELKLMGDSFDHLIWFVQISDIHLSIFHDLDRIKDFREFCSITVEAIQPAVVIASGDLSDSKGEDSIATRQFREEWIHYNDILVETSIANRTLWLDIRGNHDNFNVPSIKKSKSLYHEFSIQGKKHDRSYMYTVTKNNEKHSFNPSERYSFIAIDAALDPGPKAPWNFIGKITSNEFNVLKQFEEDSLNSNGTVWFGHYPTSCIISPEPGIRDLMKTGTAYLCGHLHTVYGAVPKMYTLQHSGFLELELGDFKENRLFRVAAFDHGLFSFIDVIHKQWPVILVTNPKNAMFNIPIKENLQWVINSSHVRILVFSPSLIKSVRVKINEGIWIDCNNTNGPLFVAKWNPYNYAHGSHKITVSAEDFDGRKSDVTQTFALDGSQLDFRFLSRIALMIDAETTLFGIFAASALLSISPLISIRLLHILVKANQISFPNIRRKWNRKILRKLWITSAINKLFLPLTLCPMYLIVGPWFVGELIDGYWGIAFAWGTFIDGNFLPGAFSYVFHGCVFVVWFYIPFVIILCHCVEKRFKMTCCNEHYSQMWNSVCIIVLMFCQALIAQLLYVFAGTTALFLGPLQIFSISFSFGLIFVSGRLTKNDFEEANVYWKYGNIEGSQQLFHTISNQNDSHDL